jgi:hypothetical protein
MKEDYDGRHFECRVPAGERHFNITIHVADLHYQIIQKRLSALSSKRLSDLRKSGRCTSIMRLVGIGNAGRRLAG